MVLVLKGQLPQEAEEEEEEEGSGRTEEREERLEPAEMREGLMEKDAER